MSKSEPKLLSSPIKLLQKSWKEYLVNAKTFTLILIIPAFLDLIIKYIIVFVLKPASLSGISSSFLLLLIIFFALLIVYVLILFWSNAALYYSIVKKSSHWKDSYHKSINKIIPLFFVSLLIFLLVSAGFVLLIIPGIILYVWLFLAPFVYFDQHKGGFSALAKSKEYVKGFWWSVFLRGLFILFIFVVVAIIFGLISDALKIPLSQSSILAIVLTPIMMLYNFELYKELKDIHSHHQEHQRQD